MVNRPAWQRIAVVVPAIPLLAACAAPAASQATSTPAMVATSEVRSTDSVSTPTQTASSEPTATAPAAESVIARLDAGEEIVITEIHMDDRTNGWAIGGHQDPGDHVLRTSDGGETWRDVTPPESAPLAGETNKTVTAFFRGPMEAWAAFSHVDRSPPDAPVVWHTEDGGETWIRSAPVDITSIPIEFYEPAFLHFATPQDGWFLVNVGAGMSHVFMAVYGTSDGGNHWDLLVEPASEYLQSCFKTGVTFADPRSGWVTRDCQGILPGAPLNTTGDGGLTWDILQLPPPVTRPDLFEPPNYCSLSSPELFTPESGIVIVRCVFEDDTGTERAGFLYRTGDGGGSWSSLPFPAESAQFLSEEVGWGLGRQIFFSRDGGRVWENTGRVSWEGQFSFVDDQFGWAVARAEDEIALVRTVNGARSWQLLEPSVGP